jgi:hypothetical protein
MRTKFQNKINLQVTQMPNQIILVVGRLPYSRAFDNDTHKNCSWWRGTGQRADSRLLQFSAVSIESFK